MIVVLAILATVLVILGLSVGKLAHSESWKATATPLGSIIGSGFPICGPLLAREFGSAAIVAMALLLLLAYGRRRHPRRRNRRWWVGIVWRMDAQ